MEALRRRLWNIIGPPSDKIPPRGSNCIYFYYLPSDIQLESLKHKFKVKQLNRLHNVPRIGYILSVFIFIQPLGTKPTPTPCNVLLDQS